jgi:hypothetical protein
MTASALVASLDRIGQVQAHISHSASVLLAMVACGAAFIPFLWPLTRHITVMAHEGAHATVASAMGRAISKIEFNSDATGATTHSGRRSILITFVGYLGPSAVGVGAAELIRIGYIVAVLWIGLAGLAAILASLRGSFGIVSVSVLVLLLFFVAGFAALQVQVITAYAVTWFLLVSGIQIIRIRGANADDAAKLRDMTWIPRSFWSVTWLIGAIVALFFGAAQLV